MPETNTIQSQGKYCREINVKRQHGHRLALYTYTPLQAKLEGLSIVKQMQKIDSDYKGLMFQLRGCFINVPRDQAQIC